MLLQGKTAVVTGSSNGMGKEIALSLARQGAHVVVNARGSAAVDEVVKEITAAGGSAMACAGAVNEVAFAEHLIDSAIREFGSVDILVNNAGVLGLGAVDRVELDHWHHVLDVNLNGTFYCCRFAVAHMRKQRWGRVINCASGSAFGSIGGACYAASKAGVIGLTYAMASDLGMFGITTNAYLPQARSVMSDSSSAGGFHAMMKSRIRRGYCDEAAYRFERDMKGPDGIAPWVTYLSLDEAHYINGQLFNLEGRRITLRGEPAEERTILRDYDREGPFSIEQLRAFAPTAFPIKNRWPRLDEQALADMLRDIDPIFH